MEIYRKMASSGLACHVNLPRFFFYSGAQPENHAPDMVFMIS